jgi:hypothetical protein
MSDFWMWFVRPFAEFAGTVGLILLVVALFSTIAGGVIAVEMIRSRIRRRS